MRTIIITAICSGIGGSIVGFILCALMTATKAEDAYAEGYQQACKDKQKG